MLIINYYKDPMFSLAAISTLLALSSQAYAHNAYATHFDGIGSPYGGCGVPASHVDHPYYLALNVQKTPGDYSTFLKRPISDSSKVGAF